MTTPFARIGGKSKLAMQIINYFPDNYDLYVEPFVGAGNIFKNFNIYEIETKYNHTSTNIVRIELLISNFPLI